MATPREEMDKFIAQHLEAEAAEDLVAATAMYADDIIHDVVGFPTGPVVGPTSTSTAT
ncbi:MAG TPA: hypothetical protein VG708_10780 [Mycobacteriales bacterium]|nr:hypothetical protein [Mycobacteriales bacterium]